MKRRMESRPSSKIDKHLDVVAVMQGDTEQWIGVFCVQLLMGHPIIRYVSLTAVKQ